MTGGSPGGCLDMPGEEVLLGTADGEAPMGGADGLNGGEPTGAEGGCAAQAAVRDATVRATRLSADRFV